MKPRSAANLPELRGVDSLKKKMRVNLTVDWSGIAWKESEEESAKNDGELHKGKKCHKENKRVLSVLILVF